MRNLSKITLFSFVFIAIGLSTITTGLISVPVFADKEKNQIRTSGLGNPTISLNPSSGPVATLVTVTGNGFDPFSTVVVNFEGDTRDTVTSTSNGGFNATFNVPSTSSI